jgi:hypothetical protein
MNFCYYCFGDLQNNKYKSPLFIQDLVIIKNNSYNFRYTNIAEVPGPRTSNYDKKNLSDMRQHRYGTHYQMRPEL